MSSHIILDIAVIFYVSLSFFLRVSGWKLCQVVTYRESAFHFSEQPVHSLQLLHDETVECCEASKFLHLLDNVILKVVMIVIIECHSRLSLFLPATCKLLTSSVLVKEKSAEPSILNNRICFKLNTFKISKYLSLSLRENLCKPW